MSMKMIEGGVTAAKGFRAAGCAAGIKKNGAADMAMIACEVPCAAAGTFTSNIVKAAPVVWDRDIVYSGRNVRAVVVNAGVANAATGAEGMRLCEQTAEAAAASLAKADPAYNGIQKEDVLIGSTGVIGVQIPIDKICAGVSVLTGKLSDSLEAGRDCATAIMTTDTVRKEAAVTFSLKDGTEAVLGGCTKGSGMIHPNMCTMLAYLTTDLKISAGLLQKALSAVVPETFNMVSVDGDTSTNDTCLLLSSGLAGNSEIVEEDEDFGTFCDALLLVCTHLAKAMAKDGEGATCLFECRVEGAASEADAKKLARSVVSSSLVKAAIAGHDANWGRILCALGYAGAQFDPEKVDLVFESAAGRIAIAKDGVAEPFSEEKATEILSSDEIIATVDLHFGDAAATAWGCDLTHEYVNINADYRS